MGLFDVRLIVIRLFVMRLLVMRLFRESPKSSALGRNFYSS